MGRIYLYDAGVELDEDGDPKWWNEDSFLFDGVTGPDYGDQNYAYMEEEPPTMKIEKVDAQTQTDNNEKSSDVLSTLVVIGIIYVSYILFFN